VTVVSASVAIVLVISGLSARQDSPKLRPELAQAHINMNFDGIMLSDAVMTLGTLADVSIRLSPEARNVLQKTRFVTEKFLYSTFEGTLARMVAYAGLTYQVIDDHTVLIVPLKK
jgi:hypothetical protein